MDHIQKSSPRKNVNPNLAALRTWRSPTELLDEVGSEAGTEVHRVPTSHCALAKALDAQSSRDFDCLISQRLIPAIAVFVIPEAGPIDTVTAGQACEGESVSEDEQ